MEDKADGASNCLSRISFLSRLWLNFYWRITRVTVISGFSSGIGMWQKWKAIPNRPWKHVNCRSSNHCVATVHVFVYCFLMEMMCKWVFTQSVQPNGSQTITVSLPIFLSILISIIISIIYFFFYFVCLCWWWACPAATLRFWQQTHLSKAQQPLMRYK